MGFEKDAIFYNDVFRKEERYSKHYRELPNFPVYQVALGMIKDLEDPKILELGCGTGQFSRMLQDIGMMDYLGVDFSETAISIARDMSKQRFFLSDIRTYIPSENFNTLVLLEVLEHIKDDCELIRKFKGMNIIFSVPSFDDDGHIRIFKRKEDVFFRYGDLINISEIMRYASWIIAKGVIGGKNNN